MARVLVPRGVAGFLSAAVFRSPAADPGLPPHGGPGAATDHGHHRISIVAADLMLAIWTGRDLSVRAPDWLYGGTPLPFVKIYPTIRIMGARRLRGGRRGPLAVPDAHPHRHDDPCRRDDRGMLSASGVNVQRVFATTLRSRRFGRFRRRVGGSALSISPGEGTRVISWHR